jgi:alpha-L-rhamnosidase
VEKFELKRQTIKDAFNKAFYNDKTGLYATGSNTTCAMPVFFGLAAPERRKHLMDALADSIRRRNNSFTSGEVGYRFLLRSLADNGYSNVVYAMNNQTNRPGYGYQIKHGATSLAEKWDGSVGSFGSQNHFMSGQINEWFFHDLAGISDDESGPGFRKIVIKPAIIGDLTWVKGSFHSISGLIKTEWKRDNDQLSVDIVVPANTSATVYLPVHDKYIVLERGKLVETANGIKQLTSENNCAVFVIGSGTYHFLVKSTGP